MEFPSVVSELVGFRCRSCRRNATVDDGDLVEIAVIVAAESERVSLRLTTSCPFCERHHETVVPDDHLGWGEIIDWLRALTKTSPTDQEEHGSTTEETAYRLKEMTVLDAVPGNADDENGEPIAIVTMAFLDEIQQPMLLTLRDARLLANRLEHVLEVFEKD
jgi:hypothetical protein